MRITQYRPGHCLPPRQTLQSVGQSNVCTDRAIDNIKSASDKTRAQSIASNAAIEAARAGDAGRGCAVVSHSSREAKNITTIIRGSIERADSGVRLAKEVSELLLAIQEATSSANGIIAGITMATQQQVKGIEQISEAADQISTVTGSGKCGRR